MAENNVPEVEDIRCKKTRSGSTAYDELITAVDTLSMLSVAFFQDIDGRRKLAELDDDAYNGLATSFAVSVAGLQNLRDDVFEYEESHI